MRKNIKVTTKFSVKNITVEPETNTIVKNGKTKRLEPKLIELLCFLIKHPIQVHSRQELAENIWPNVVVGDEAINRSIFALRNALGDNAKSPTFIETIPKKGYRFLIAIEDEIKADDNDKKHKICPTHLILYICFFILLVTGVFFISQNNSNKHQIDKILPITQMAGIENSIAVNASNPKNAFYKQYRTKASFIRARFNK